MHKLKKANVKFTQCFVKKQCKLILVSLNFIKNFNFNFINQIALKICKSKIFSSSKLSAGFTTCNFGIPGSTCNCGIQFQYDDTTIYMDTCGIAPNINNLKFFTYTPASLPVLINCDNKIVPVASETNDAWWNTAGNVVSSPNNKIFCAKSTSGSYIVI
jgi:hypothetical protein